MSLFSRSPKRVSAFDIFNSFLPSHSAPVQSSTGMKRAFVTASMDRIPGALIGRRLLGECGSEKQP